MDRSKLPYRKNCEGYFVAKDGRILARNTGLGYIEFPGGGIDGDDIAAGMARECLEETGAIVSGMREIGVIYFDWAPDWPKTDKQKQRYDHYRGEQMHLFVGRIDSIGTPLGDPEHGDDGWNGDPLMSVGQIVGFLESIQPFPKPMAEYYSKQLWAIQHIDDLLRDSTDLSAFPVA